MTFCRLKLNLNRKRSRLKVDKFGSKTISLISHLYIGYYIYNKRFYFSKTCISTDIQYNGEMIYEKERKEKEAEEDYIENWSELIKKNFQKTMLFFYFQDQFGSFQRNGQPSMAPMQIQVVAIF